jgi:hypothetical protein
MRLVFTDTLYEDADTYRFGIEGAANIFGRRLNWVPRAEDFPDYRVSEDVPLSQYRGNPEWRAFLAELRDRAAIAIPELVWLVDGRDIWEVFRDERFLLNSQRDPCSKILKRRKMNEWLASSCDPALDVIVYGIGEHERHRFDDGEGRGIFHRLAANGWNAEAPLIGKPEINPTLHMRAEGIEPSRQYGLGYLHDNCGGGCGKGGHAHWQHRFRVQPDRFAYDQLMERKVRDYLGQGTFLTDRRGDGKKKPLPLDRFRQELESSPELIIDYEPGSSGCGCMLDEAA